MADLLYFLSYWASLYTSQLTGLRVLLSTFDDLVLPLQENAFIEKNVIGLSPNNVMAVTVIEVHSELN